MDCVNFILGGLLPRKGIEAKRKWLKSLARDKRNWKKAREFGDRRQVKLPLAHGVGL